MVLDCVAALRSTQVADIASESSLDSQALGVGLRGKVQAANNEDRLLGVQLHRSFAELGSKLSELKGLVVDLGEHLGVDVVS